MNNTIFVGLDVHKNAIAVAITKAGREDAESLRSRFLWLRPLSINNRNVARLRGSSILPGTLETWR